MKNLHIMRLMALSFCCAAVLLISTGCRGRELNVVIGPPEEELDWGGDDDIDPWEALAFHEEWAEPRFKPEFIPAGRAAEAPELSILDESGAGQSIDLAEQWDGEIVIVVFWSMDSWVARSSVLHVGYLMDRYGEYGVRGVGIACNPDTYGDAPDFLDVNEVWVDSYFDYDFGALHKLGGAVGLEIGYELPCFFMIDRAGRVRFSKIGFSSSAVSDDLWDVTDVTIKENAPRGERIEDYLRKLIEEVEER